MKVTGFLTVAQLLFTVGISAGRQLQQGNAVHTIDPWAPGIQYPPLSVAQGTIIKFVWTGPNGVDRVPNGPQCPSDFTPSPSNGILVLVPVSNGGPWPLPIRNDHSNHCGSNSSRLIVDSDQT
ncbi:hypothetical protein WJX75_009448 [Coccomyxa subellipsoidea]|uniref:Plastocyanin-like domain-containing protein n=1 Tax=Coccomyxa subellipsoidea TaxID=248742 RepID=A0ABR2YZA7_9CHLO